MKIKGKEVGEYPIPSGSESLPSENNIFHLSLYIRMKHHLVQVSMAKPDRLILEDILKKIWSQMYFLRQLFLSTTSEADF